MKLTESKKCTNDADNPPEDPQLLKIHKQWETDCISVNGIKLRAGHFPSKTHPPKANVLYLEGLADSMFNHDRLVNTLSEAGYRIIAFDYPGQGGSEGSMGQTRITEIKTEKSFWTSILDAFDDDHRKDKRFAEFKAGLSKHKPGSLKKLFIRDMADAVWEKIKNDNDSEIGSKEQVDAVIGWSTGGLAAYDMAV